MDDGKTEPTEASSSAPRRALAAWCVYDWANSAFPTVIATFVFAAYFTKGVAADPITGTTQWAYAMSLSALAVAASGPFLGAIADHGGRRKPWIAACTALCVAATAMLWFAEPSPAWVVWALAFAALANFAFETGTIFYNAMLPDLAPRRMIGRLSGWGWGLGYAGGLACLVVVYFGLIEASPPPFGLDAEAAEPTRASVLVVAAWFFAFSLPFFLLTPDTPATGLAPRQAIRRGVRTLIDTLRHVRAYRSIVHYLVARMVYTDGLNTLFAVGGIYAAVTFGMDFGELLLFAIALNVTAGLGAAAFGWMDDRVGAKPTILVALVGLSAIGTALLIIDSKFWFWIVALPLGLFFGPAQSASRSLMARMAPPGMVNEMFGLYAFSGKATAFVGPALFGLVTDLADSQRAGMATVLVFLLVGFALLLPLRVPRR